MHVSDQTNRLERLRIALAEKHSDPRRLHDEVQAMISLLRQNLSPVPQDLRDAAEELQAEVLEDFYDNLPV